MIRRLVAASVVIGLASIVGLSIFVATAPARADPIDVDAVMVHIGGEGERIEAALELWDEHAGHPHRERSGRRRSLVWA